MSLRAAAVGVITAVFMSVLTAFAGPAQAAPCTVTNFSPRNVVVGLNPVTKTFGVSTTGCVMTGWTIQESQYGMYVWEGAPQETFNPGYLRNDDAGRLDMVVTADSDDWQSRTRTFVDGFSLLRRTHWQAGTFDASPEPVAKGRLITVKGRLMVVDWDNGAFVGYGGRRIHVQFRVPNGTWATVKLVGTGPRGWVNTTVTANRTGEWRLRFAGNPVAAASAPTGDLVQVR